LLGRSVLRTGVSNDIDRSRVPVREVETTPMPACPAAPKIGDDVRHRRLVVVTHEAEVHAVRPIWTLAVGSSAKLPKLKPKTVVTAPLESGKFGGTACDTTGAANRFQHITPALLVAGWRTNATGKVPSNVKTCEDVPST
jgi:hypothetical protein